MNYEESEIVLKEIEKVDSFVLFCHEGPDFDSIISCLLVGRILKKMGKKVDIFSPEDIGDTNRFLDKEGEIKVSRPASVDFSKYQVFFALDVNDLKRYGLDKDYKFNGKIINIDHHEGERCGDINIFDRNTGSTASLLFLIFRDWKLSLSVEELNLILIGLISDTGVFHFSMYQTTKAFRIVSELMDAGANYEQALFYVDQCNNLGTYQFYAEVLKNIAVDEENRFAYTLINKDTYKKYKDYGIRTRNISDGFLRNISGTDFGIVMLEQEKGKIKVSIRTRTPGYNVIDLVKQLGGGGHLTGGGATVVSEKGDTRDAVDQVLQYAREFHTKNSS